MYENSKGLVTPPDDTHLWRYMNLNAFLYLLRSKCLYFCRKRELDDKWEGVHAPGVKAAIEKYVEASDWPEDVRRHFPALVETLASRVAINCWHENDGESVAMWNLYTQGFDGVAICTTVERLKRAVGQSEHKVYIGRVHYADYTNMGPGDVASVNALTPIFQKRMSFRHECEVRAVITDEGIRNQPIISLIEQPAPPGLLLPVDLDILIERIVAARTYPAWAIPAFRDIVASTGLSVTVETSDLLKEPRLGNVSHASAGS